MAATLASQELAELAERFWRFQCNESPVAAIAAGEDTKDAMLFRESPSDYDRRRAATVGMLAELDAVVVEALPAQERATYQLLRRELQNGLDFHDVFAHGRPQLFPLGPEYAAVGFANMASIQDAGGAKLYNERLATLPMFVRDIQANLRAGYEAGFRYPLIVLQAAIGNLRATITGPVEDLVWFGPFKRSIVAERPAVRQEGERTRELLRDTLVPTLAAHADFLEKILSEGARETIACTDAPLGREFYQVLVRNFTTTDRTPDEIHELGLAEVDRLVVEIEAVAVEAGYPGGVAAYRNWLATDPQFIAPSGEKLREHMEMLCKRIDKLIPSFFGHLPRITYGVESIPEAESERRPIGYAQPNPANRTAPGIFRVTGLPKRCPSYTYLPLALHEAWPGHLMQVPLMQELEDLPMFRRHGALKYAACVEGWALYCEGLGAEMGLYETPHQKYGRFDMEMWRAVRLVVDTGIHWKGWNRAQAIEYMVRYLSLPRATIEGEVDRYIAMPAQALAYQIGNLTFRSLRQRAEQTLGDHFDLRAFHDALLRTGPVTVPVLEDLINDWIQTAALN